MAKLPTRDMVRALAIAISTVSRRDGVIDGLCASTWMMPFTAAGTGWSRRRIRKGVQSRNSCGRNYSESLAAENSVEESCVSLCSGVYWRACQRRNLRIPPLPEAWKRARPNLAHRTSPRSAMSQGHSPRTRRSALVINICWSKCRPRRMALTRGKTNWRRSADGDFR